MAQKKCNLLIILLFLNHEKRLLIFGSICPKGFEDAQGVLITEYLPDSYMKDGSINYQKELQEMIDMAAGYGVL